MCNVQTFASEHRRPLVATNPFGSLTILLVRTPSGRVSSGDSACLSAASTLPGIPGLSGLP